jgi:hypothetical protein
MSIEERLTRVLAQEAEQVDVDVTELRHRTRERLVDSGHRSTGRRRLSGPLAAAAAVAVLVVGGGVLGSRLADGDSGADEPAAPVTGGRAHDVATRFTCPEHAPVDLSGAQDEFVPTLGTGNPGRLAESLDAPRYVFEVTGRRAELRLGNADGTLGSVASYRRAGDAWDLVSAEACTGTGTSAAPPTAHDLQPGTHGVAPHPPQGALAFGADEGEPVMVDDRPVYDYSGLVTRHRTIYAAPCGDRKMCWRAGDPTSGLIGRRPTRTPSGGSSGDPNVQDVGEFLVLPDDLVGRSNPLGMWAVYDDGDGTTFAAVMRDGTLRPATRLTRPSWQGGSLLVVIAPRADVAELRVR